jgi:small-conductance mechanosensitive channel
MSDVEKVLIEITRAKKSKARLVLVGAFAAVLVVCLAASYLTQGAMSGRPRQRVPPGLVDQQPWQTASALSALAASSEEKQFAREAERMADHEVDQAFAMALRQAEMETNVLTGPALVIQQKVNALAAQVKDDQAAVDGLNAQVEAAKRGGVAAAALGDDLDVAKARLQLDTDELNDANDDLARASGDKRAQIQQELTAREASMQKYDSQANSQGEPAVISQKRFTTLARRIGAWLDQRSRQDSIEQAQTLTDADVASLTAQYATLHEQSRAAATTIGDENAGAAANGAAQSNAVVGGSDGKGKLARMARVHELAQVQSILEDRLDTEKRLSSVYAKWIAQVDLQHRIVLHLVLQSMAGIAALLMGAVLVWWLVQALLDRAVDRAVVDARSIHTLRTVASLAIEGVTLLLVLLFVFGAPSQMPTILGLCVAGLTVVFQNFILAFFGWFMLMGRNGIRVGDWVEINGVAGEVVEVGLFRTTLLETGNGTDKGHPTGRRARFLNSFAVTGQFFNFSTTGQWMWDEISVNVPEGEGSYQTIEAIHKAVLQQTEKDAMLAETEWKGVSRQHVLGQLSAAPLVNLRPAASGIDILVRYVTRAKDRFEMRNKLYQTVIELLHKPAGAAADAGVQK